MDKLMGLVGGRKILNISLGIFLLTYLFLIVVNMSTLGVKLQNTDFFIDHFSSYLEKGHYQAVEDGTSVVYSLCLKAIYTLTSDVESAFIILNGLSQLLILVLGIFLVNTIYKGEKSIHYKIVLLVYGVYIINSGYYIRAWNDFFLGVFITAIFIVFLKALSTKKMPLSHHLIAGVLLAIIFSIRPTAIIILPLILYICIVLLITIERSKTYKMKGFLLLFLGFVSVLGVLHYPSLKAHGTLSSYHKDPILYHRNPEIKNTTWIQRNYLGLKKVERGEAPLNRDAVWIHTNFSDVDAYLKANGDTSLPRTFTEFLLKDPILLAKLTMYNMCVSIVRFIRFWGLLFALLLLPIFRPKKIRQALLDIKQIPALLFLLVISILSLVCCTFMEFRWYTGYEALIPLAILFQLDRFSWLKNSSYKNALFSISLVIVTVFNFRTIFNLL